MNTTSMVELQDSELGPIAGGSPTSEFAIEMASGLVGLGATIGYVYFSGGIGVFWAGAAGVEAAAITKGLLTEMLK